MRLKTQTTTKAARVPKSRMKGFDISVCGCLLPPAPTFKPVGELRDLDSEIIGFRVEGSGNSQEGLPKQAAQKSQTGSRKSSSKNSPGVGRLVGLGFRV